MGSRVTGVGRIYCNQCEVGVLGIGNVPVSKTKGILRGYSCACASAPRVWVSSASKKSEPLIVDKFYRFVPS